MRISSQYFLHERPATQYIVVMQKPTANTKKLLHEYKKTLSLSQTLFDLSIGTLLGDASLQTQDGGKTYRLKFQQSEILHREYLFHLHGQFSDWVLSPPYFLEKRNMWGFQTISHSEFTRLADIFLIDSQGNPCKKHIKAGFVERFLSPLGLAYWIMDDGGKSSYNKDYPRKGFALNTHGFPKEQVEILCQGLQNRYGLDCWLRPNKKKWTIVISGHDHTKMMELIGDFLIPSMYHKIPGLDI